MSDPEIIDRRRAWMEEHLRIYLETDGAEGHIVDLSDIGGRGPTTTLLLTTTGRRSGNAITVPLIYGKYGDEYVVIASKGGADHHPAWYLNFETTPDVAFQVGRAHLHGSWRVAQGEERRKVWDFMADLYPPYLEYQASTAREIPVVMLKPAD